MISTLKLPLSFKAAPLRRDLDALPSSEWTPHFNTQYYEGDWSGVALRAPVGAHVALYPDPTAEGYEDTETLSRCPSVSDVLGEFHCPTEAVRFLRLGPGAIIREHRDYRLSYEDGLARVHIPIKTSAAVEFYLGGERIEMNEGDAWYLNFNLPHSVKNNGADERVHLVIDCVVNDWFREIVSSRRD